MAATLWIGTRKGLFIAHRGDSGWRLGKPHFAGEPVTQVLVDPYDGAWYAALRLGHFGIKLRKSLDRGASWQEMAAPAFPPKPTEGPWKDDATPWTVDQVWALEASPDGRLWAGCLPAGLFSSRDGGASWHWSKACGTGPSARTGLAVVTTTPASTPSWSIRAIHLMSRSRSLAAASGKRAMAAPAGRIHRRAWWPTSCPRNGAKIPTSRTRTASTNASRSPMSCGASTMAAFTAPRMLD